MTKDNLVICLLITKPKQTKMWGNLQTYLQDKMMKYENNTKTSLCSVVNQEWDNEICREVS